MPEIAFAVATDWPVEHPDLCYLCKGSISLHKTHLNRGQQQKMPGILGIRTELEGKNKEWIAFLEN